MITSYSIKAILQQGQKNNTARLMYRKQLTKLDSQQMRQILARTQKAWLQQLLRKNLASNQMKEPGMAQTQGPKQVWFSSKVEVAPLIQQDQNKGDETSVYVLPLPPITPYYCPQYYCVSQNNFRIVGRILCTPVFIPFSVEYLGELPMNID